MGGTGTDVTDVDRVVVTTVDDDEAFDVLVGGRLLPLHPTRDDAIATSSYQNVFVSPPYDSQPK